MNWGPKPLSPAETLAELRADYDGARESEHVRTRIGLAPNGGSGDYHIRNETAYFRMMEKSRDFVRNDTIIGKTIERSALNIVGGGPTLSPDTGDKILDRDLYDRWVEWGADADECDEAGELTYAEQLQIRVQSMLTDGDIVTLGLENGRLQTIEGHLVRNPRGYKTTAPRCVVGVELGPTRRRTAYHVREESIDPNRSTISNNSKPYPTRNSDGLRQVFHLLVPQRVSLTRGVNALAPVFYLSQQFEDLNFAKLVQAQVVSCFALWRYQEAAAPGSDLPTGMPAYGAQETVTNSDGSERLVDQVRPGMELQTKPGERIEGFSPNVPNSEYFNHAKLLLTLIGINLGQPFVMMMMDASESNFSGWRAAVEEARRGFRRNQRSLIERECTPQYRWKVAQWMTKDAALRNSAKRSDIHIARHSFRLPNWPYISPTEDAAAGLLRIRNTLTSPRRYHQEISQDWEEIATETVEDNSFAIKGAMAQAAAINKANPTATPVHWRELLSLPTPDGVAVSIASPTQAPTATAKPTPGGSDNAT